MKSTYSAEDIQVLQGLDAVRKRPGMYIGSTGSRGLHHLVWEIVDNAIDEAANGFADHIDVTIHKDSSITIEDNGRGLPVGLHAQMGVSAVEVVFTQLHAGGKFNDSNYAYSGGLHGVGASVVNALSEWLIVEIFTQGKAYRQEYRSYTDETGTHCGIPQAPLAEVGNTRRHGSRISFMPDREVFQDQTVSYDTVSRRLRELAFLNQGIGIDLVDERVKDENGYKKRQYQYHGGIRDFVRYLNANKTAVHNDVIYLEGDRDDIRAAIAIQFNDSYNEGIYSYVNSIPTTEGGAHETGFKAAWTKVMNDFARERGWLKEKDSNLTGEDYREGMTAIMSLRMKNIEFEGQTKTKLGNTEARAAVEAIVSERLGLYLENPQNQETVSAMMDKALRSAKVREAARKAKDLTRKKNSLEAAPLVGKLSSCTGRNAMENELFIVEGDSAGGSAKQGRDRRFQAILPLRGKPLNAEKKRLDQVLANEEFRTIISALGTGIEGDFNLSSLKYGKVIILSDADQDGAHIRAILLTFFFRYMRELVTEGHVFIGQAPLYAVKRGQQIEYAYNERELEKLTRGRKQYTVQRYKGLGEMNPEQLWETTMNPAHRNLIRVGIEDGTAAEQMVTVWMGDKAEPRRDYISEHANFNKNDKFAEKQLASGIIAPDMNI